MKKGLVVLLFVVLLIAPVAVFAQTQDGPVGLTINVVAIMGNIVGYVWQFFAGLSVIMFLFAGILFLTSSGDPGKVGTARQAVIWGVVGIVVAVFAYSAITIISNAIK